MMLLKGTIGYPVVGPAEAGLRGKPPGELLEEVEGFYRKWIGSDLPGLLCEVSVVLDPDKAGSRLIGPRYVDLLNVPAACEESAAAEPGPAVDLAEVLADFLRWLSLPQSAKNSFNLFEQLPGGGDDRWVPLEDLPALVAEFLASRPEVTP